MWSLIYETFFCPQDGILFRYWWMIPAALMSAGMFMRRFVCWWNGLWQERPVKIEVEDAAADVETV